MIAAKLMIYRLTGRSGACRAMHDESPQEPQHAALPGEANLGPCKTTAGGWELWQSPWHRFRIAGT